MKFIGSLVAVSDSDCLSGQCKFLPILPFCPVTLLVVFGPVFISLGCHRFDLSVVATAAVSLPRADADRDKNCFLSL